MLKTAVILALLYSFGAIAFTSEYIQKIQPIFNNRCVLCHSCGNSPCQLNLSSYEGFKRGASKLNQYNLRRTSPMEPSRLYIDAQGSEWRGEKFGFFPIVPEDNGQFNILEHILDMRSENPTFDSQFNSAESRSCVQTKKDFEIFKKEKPFAGMPYGFQPLEKNETQVLKNWIANGSPGPSLEEEEILKTVQDKNVKSQIHEWEQFLNNQHSKYKLTARYLYEHLFLAHIYFGNNEKEFFRLVRSKSFTGPIVEINTERPFYDPKSTFKYRFQKIHSTIMHKNHITFRLNSDQMSRISNLFINSEWPSETSGGIQEVSYSDNTSNPFKIFEQIPARARYQFMLDHSRYFIMTFLKGPVCYGNFSINVIEDHFFGIFIKPSSDRFIVNSNYQKEVIPLLELPLRVSINLKKKFSLNFQKREIKYSKARYQEYSGKSENSLGLFRPAMNDLWDGDGFNKNATLTIYRHHDSGSVLYGLQGGLPKTMWVLDYPIFERIYYSLVANFSQFDSINHSLTTRKFFDNIRSQSEHNYLSFLPEKVRKPLLKSWYQGIKSEVYRPILFPFHYDFDTGINFENCETAQNEFYEKLKSFYSKRVLGEPDKMNNREMSITANDEENTGYYFSQIAHLKNKGFFKLPDISMARVKFKTGKQSVYTLIKNIGYKNISFIFGENKRILEKETYLNVFKGVVGSYPDFYWDVEADKVQDFVKTLSNLDSKNNFDALVKTYGVSRSSHQFWLFSDWINSYAKDTLGVEAGLLDLNRYENF